MRSPIEILLLNGGWKGLDAGVDAHFTLHRGFDAQALERVLAEAAPRIRAIVTYSGAHVRVDGALLDRLPAVEIVCNGGVGHESVDLPALRARGIPLTNGRGSNSVDVAEHALGLILAVARNIALGDRFVRSLAWPQRRLAHTHRVSGRHLGLLGMGGIGQELARLASAMAMRVSYTARAPRPALPYSFVPDLVELARAVDFLVVAAPGGPETRHMVDRAVLDALGPQGVLVNIGRGSVVDEAELVLALQEGRLGGAGLDVFEHEPEVPLALTRMDNVVLQPHQAGSTYEAVDEAVALLLANLQAKFAGQALLTPVD